MAGLNCTCAHCGAGFSTSRETKIYCSRKCNTAAWKIRNPEKHKENARKESAQRPKSTSVSFNACVTCGNPFVSKRKRLYCGSECLPTIAHISIAPAVRQCLCCGKNYAPTFTGGRPKEYCSDECRFVAYKEAQRVKKSKRKAVIRGATIERVDPFVVFARDRWRCKLCGRKTPTGKRGTYEDNAPELDHIIPLAAGGEHSYRNTQCACRKCNSNKSSTPRGQLLMFG